MNYTDYEKEEIRDLSFYCVLDYVDATNHFHNAERIMKAEREKALNKMGGFEIWKEKIYSDRNRL